VVHEHLVDGFAAVHRALLGMRAAQEHRRGAGVIGARVGSFASCHRMSEVGDHGESVAQLVERLQRLGELEAGAFLRGRPLVHRGAVRHVDAAEAALGESGRVHQARARGNHRVEQRQRQRDTHSLQERAAR
jgi:hypothetical protein